MKRADPAATPGARQTTPAAGSVDEYVAGFPPEVQAVLHTVRATVRAAAPEAEERISYRMPAVFQQGVVVYFAAFKHHIGLFPPVEDRAVQARVAAYAGPKGNLQFPYSQPIPHALITAVVEARLRANQARKAGPRSQRTSKEAAPKEETPKAAPASAKKAAAAGRS